jgi:spore maturation protein CgeB
MTLNVTRAAMAAMGWCPVGRLFEAAACGCPLLSDTWDGLDAFFRPGTEILTATSTEEAWRPSTSPDAELARIGRAARERTLERAHLRPPRRHPRGARRGGAGTARSPP